jgi:hypothetical protein
MYRSLLRGLSLITIVFGLIIVASSTAVISSTGTNTAAIHCLNGINTTLLISVVLFFMSYLAERSLNTQTALGIDIMHLLRSVLILSIVMTVTSTALRITSSGHSAMLQASSYIWIISGGIFAATIYVLSLLVSKKSKQLLQEQ